VVGGKGLSWDWWADWRVIVFMDRGYGCLILFWFDFYIRSPIPLVSFIHSVFIMIPVVSSTGFIISYGLEFFKSEQEWAIFLTAVVL
jgi:hypothetical protein